MRKKVYTYRTAPFMMATGIVILLCAVLPAIIDPKNMWEGIILLGVPAVAWICYLIFTGVFTPMYLSDSGIEYKKEKYTWAEIKITACRQGWFQYFLVFDTRFLIGEEKRIKQKLRKGFCVHMAPQALSEIFKYYTDRILVLDGYYEKETLPDVAPKLKAMVIEHNRAVENQQKDGTNNFE